MSRAESEFQNRLGLAWVGADLRVRHNKLITSNRSAGESKLQDLDPLRIISLKCRPCVGQKPCLMLFATCIAMVSYFHDYGSETVKVTVSEHSASRDGTDVKSPPLGTLTVH